MEKQVRQIEDLDCWKQARILVKMVYQATNLKPFSNDFGLKDQIQRASVSIMANIAEGFDSYSNAEFLRYLGYASRSSVEVKSHLYVALDLNYVSQNVFEELADQAQKCTAFIKGLIKYLNTKKA